MRLLDLTSPAASIALLLSIFSPSSGQAQTPPAAAPSTNTNDFAMHRLTPELDIPLAATAAGLALAYLLVEDSVGGRSCGGTSGLPCDSSSLSFLDRYATTRDSGFARSASDYTLIAALATPIVLELATMPGDHDGRAAGVLADAVVVGEVMAITAGMTAILKSTIGRARPSMFRGDGLDEYDSFPSGHTSLAFSAAVAGCSLYVRREDPSFGEGALACLPGLGLAAATALLRVEGGRHFPTDVLAGAAIGSAIGLIVPWLHGDPRKERNMVPGVAPSSAGLIVGVSGTF